MHTGTHTRPEKGPEGTARSCHRHFAMLLSLFLIVNKLVLVSVTSTTKIGPSRDVVNADANIVTNSTDRTIVDPVLPTLP